jgi:predicted GIY-YIG superfamily endonuclease
MNYCYILKSNNKTYIGYTINPSRRIKQHNGELVGGAKSTKGNEWDFLCIITSKDEKFTKKLALSIEWNLKNPLGKNKRDKKYIGVEGKLNSIILVLNRYSIHFNVYVVDMYKEKLSELKKSTIHSINDFNLI